MKKILLMQMLVVLVFSHDLLKAEESDQFERVPMETEQPATKYIQVSGGLGEITMSKVDHMRTTFNRGFNVSLLFGYRLGKGFCIEGEYTYFRNTTDTVHTGWRKYNIVEKIDRKLQGLACMANLIWEMPKLKDITPFIGVGGGADYLEWKTGYHKYRNEYLAWQLLTGVSYSLREDIDLTLEYKFHKVYKCTNNTIALGLKIPVI